MKVKAAMPWCVTALVFAVCLLLPLLFLPESVEVPDVSGAEQKNARAEVFALYRADELERTALDEEELTNEEVINSTRLFNTVAETLVIDTADDTSDPSGSRCFTLEHGGETIRVIERFREWTGDWHNWLRVWMDIDTWDVYHLYYSANVVENQELYIGSYEEMLQEAAGNLMSALGFISWELAQDGENTWVITLENEEGLRYNYSAVLLIYEDAAPSLLVDLDINLISVEAA